MTLPGSHKRPVDLAPYRWGAFYLLRDGVRAQVIDWKRIADAGEPAIIRAEEATDGRCFRLHFETCGADGMTRLGAAMSSALSGDHVRDPTAERERRVLNGLFELRQAWADLIGEMAQFSYPASLRDGVLRIDTRAQVFEGWFRPNELILVERINDWLVLDLVTRVEIRTTPVW